jgi:F-type H+-transporting ATPase subunit epsilon
LAKTPFKVEVLTPEGEAFNDEVEMVSTRTGVGSIGVLNGHQPLLAMLDPTELRLYRGENDVERFAQGEGFLQVGAEQTMILVDELVPVDDLDASELQDRLRNADSEVERCEQGTEARRVAEREKRRLEAFLKIAEGR